MPKTTIVIADDHSIVLLGVRQLVEATECFEVVAEASNSTDLIARLHATSPDILITDYNMPGDTQYGDGLKLIDYLVRHFPGMQVLVLTMVSNDLILSRLYDLGVAGVVQKSQLHAEIERALEALVHKRKYKATSLERSWVRDDSPSVDARIASLSPKEMEVLRLFIAGMSLNDIARVQNRSAKTISTQKVAAMHKLDVRTDQELIAFCLAEKLFQ
ncbi:response regulator [Pseudomonas plecoglossicida]|uniref:DNA-binding response regulator n=1 Tax=Pseudomonas plecoglossicida TaxID=70775 RepID=A0AAD0R2P1_PSEDL|nr:response regulator [Pseudomonas plecoglossicida]AXM99107.1 DNA-binding response regulator [Pseudomonas plecoglossicida]QLB54364.1 response regulator [Pseudomonas plecoglossicida]